MPGQCPLHVTNRQGPCPQEADVILFYHPNKPRAVTSQAVLEP